MANTISQDDLLARLLGLSTEEVKVLQHLGLKECKDEKGDALYFYVRISTGNPSYLLEKIDMDKEHIARFAPKKVLQFME